MFERFTTEARGVVERAKEHATRRSDAQIGPEHLLLSACDGQSSCVQEVLESSGLSIASVETFLAEYSPPDGLSLLGIDRATVSAVADTSFGADALVRAGQVMSKRQVGYARRNSYTCFTHQSKVVLEQALRLALERKDNFICDAHVVSATIGADDEMIEALLRALDIDAASLQEAVQCCIIEQ